MTSISELIAILEEIKKKHGDIPVRVPEYENENECCICYEDIKKVHFLTEKKKVYFEDEDGVPHIVDDPNAESFVVIE